MIQSCASSLARQIQASPVRWSKSRGSGRALTKKPVLTRQSGHERGRGQPPAPAAGGGGARSRRRPASTSAPAQQDDERGQEGQHIARLAEVHERVEDRGRHDPARRNHSRAGPARRAARRAAARSARASGPSPTITEAEDVARLGQRHVERAAQHARSAAPRSRRAGSRRGDRRRGRRSARPGAGTRSTAPTMRAPAASEPRAGRGYPRTAQPTQSGKSSTSTDWRMPAREPQATAPP